MADMAKQVIEKTELAFAAGNYFQFYKIHKYEDGRVYIYGRRWIKSKKQFSKNDLINYVGFHYEEINENKLPK